MADNDYYNVDREQRNFSRSRADILNAEFLTVEEGFDELPSKNTLSGNVQTLAPETSDSAANVYILKSDYPITSYVKGLEVKFFCANTNTSAATVNVDGLGVKDIKKIDGTDLDGSEMVSGWPVHLIYNGMHFRLLNSAKKITAGIVLASALTPRNYARNSAIDDLILPEASGGATPYTYAVSGLPAGLSFDTATRIISGTPTTLGSSTVTYTVTDANGLEFPFQFQINIVAVALSLGDPSDRTLTVGNAYEFTLPIASGGTSPYSYAVSGLPPGLAFDPESRELAGVPTESGVFNPAYSVSDSGTIEQTASQSFELTVRSASALAVQDVPDMVFEPNAQITPFTLPAASGGVSPYIYIVTGLGEGLNFNDDSREISGTPTTTGVRFVTYRAEDQEGIQVDSDFTITIEVEGRRYITVVEDEDSINATDIQSGNNYAADEQELRLPDWTGNRFIVIAQPAANADLTSISLSGFGNSLSDFDKKSYTRTINGLSYELWVSIEEQGDVIAEETLEVRP